MFLQCHQAIDRMLKHLQDSHGRFYCPEKSLSMYESVRGLSLHSGLQVQRNAYIRELIPAVCFAVHVMKSRLLNTFNARKYATFSLLLTLSLTSAFSAGIVDAAKIAALIAAIASIVVTFAIALYSIIFPAEVSEVLDIIADIRVGDRLWAIHKNPVSWWPISILNRYLGQKESKICSIEGEQSIRDDDEIEVSFIRKVKNNNTLASLGYEFITHNVTWDYFHLTKLPHHLLPHQTHIGYIRLEDFHEHSCSDFTHALSGLEQECKAKNQELKGLVIDLRGNSGGSLVQALEIAALFLAKDKPLLQISGRFFYQTVRSTNTHSNMLLSLLFLVDDRTASASEILVEALCANNRATSLGRKSYGKNTAQVCDYLK